MREDMTLGRPNLAGRTSGSYVSGVGMCRGGKEAIRRTKASTQILLVVGPFSTKGTDRFHQRAALRPLTPQALTAMSGKVGYEGCQPPSQAADSFSNSPSSFFGNTQSPNCQQRLDSSDKTLSPTQSPTTRQDEPERRTIRRISPSSPCSISIILMRHQQIPPGHKKLGTTVQTNAAVQHLDQSPKPPTPTAARCGQTTGQYPSPTPRRRPNRRQGKLGTQGQDTQEATGVFPCGTSRSQCS